jgi:hypothetical protein
MTVSEGWTANRGTVRLILCVIAIVIGVLMYVNAFHVGDAHKGVGVVEATLGILGLV